MKMPLYLVQVAACTGVFYLFYHLILARFTFFTLNRWYLLGTLLVSFLIPLITIPADAPLAVPPVKNVALSAIQHIYTGKAPIQPLAPVAGPFQWAAIISFVYLIGAGIFCMLLFISFNLFYRRIRTSQLISAGNIKIVKGTGKQRNGSFLNYVFINEEGLSATEIDQIIQHELIHARQLHSIDNLLARIARMVLWFNPFSYAYIQAISANHEYEVDQKVAAHNDKAIYAGLILRLATDTRADLLNSYFSMHPLRKRITMIFNTPTKKIKQGLYLFVLPLVVISLCCFANRELIEQNVLVPSKAVLKPGAIESKVATGASPLKHAAQTGRKNDTAVASHPGSKISGTALFEKLRKLPAVIVSAVMEDEPPSTRFKRLSVIDLPDSFGANPMVLIDGKTYPATILEQISKACIAGTSTFRIEAAVEQYGEQAREGLVKIKTKNGEITYLDEQQRSNLSLLKSTANRLFVRVPFSDAYGASSDEDYIVVRRSDGSTMMSSPIAHNQKAAFIIEGKVYSEKELEGTKAYIGISGGHGTAGVDYFPAYASQLKGYSQVFFFSDNMATIKGETTEGK